MLSIISWYTPQYKDVMDEYLRPSLKKLDIPYKIYPIDSIGDWRANTCLKPTIIEKAFFQELDRDLLIIDSDARIYDYPKLLDEIPIEYDCAMFWLDWNEWYKNGSDIKQLATGTLYFRNRPICKELIKVWQEFCSSTPMTDQKVLELALVEFPDLKIYKLPYEYLWINSLPGNRKPFVKRPDNVIIEHFQISRRLK